LKSYLLSGGFWNGGHFMRPVGEKVNPELIRQYVRYQNRKRGEQVNSPQCVLMPRLQGRGNLFL